MSKTIMLDANGLFFPALEAGEGPLVLLLHGFPDGPETWAAQMKPLTRAGYRAVAVTSRGYAPECQPRDGDYHVETLAKDVIGWIGALSVERAHLVAHDWGATIGYAAAALAPERLASLTTIAVPHPGRMFAVVAADPEQLALYDYTQLFLQPEAQAQVAADDFAYLEELWRRWSPGWTQAGEAITAMKRRMAASGVLPAALDYYRQVGDGATALSQRSLALLTAPVPVPTLAIAGVEDRCNLLRTMRAALLSEDFPKGIRLEVVAGAGHWPHREQPERFNTLLLAHLARTR